MCGARTEARKSASSKRSIIPAAKESAHAVNTQSKSIVPFDVHRSHQAAAALCAVRSLTLSNPSFPHLFPSLRGPTRIQGAKHHLCDLYRKKHPRNHPDMPPKYIKSSRPLETQPTVARTTEASAQLLYRPLRPPILRPPLSTRMAG